MFVGDAKNPVQIPQEVFSSPLVPNKKPSGDSTAADFEKMLSESNTSRQSELEKEKNAVGSNGEFHIGESKNDKEFREQLEKITGKKQEKAKNKLDQNDYLTLLVTQLKYQDPSKPMEHYQMASQMAQFNTVEQLVGVNSALKNLNKAQTESRSDKLSPYIDKYVEVQGNSLKLNSDKTTSVARFELSSPASTVSLELKDEQGKLVRTLNLGEMQAGNHEVHWDGKDTQRQDVPAGTYTFVVHAASEDGKEMSAKTSYLARVNGVTDILTGGKLDTTAGSVDPAKIVSIRNYEPQKKTPIPPSSLENKGAEHGIH